MEIVGHGVRVGMEAGTRVLRFRDVGANGGGPNAGDGFLSSLLDGQGGVGNQVVMADGAGPARLGETAPGASALGGLHLRADPTADGPGWRLLHGGVSCVWPAGVSVVAGEAEGPWRANELHISSDSALIHIQGPLEAAGPVPLFGDLAPRDHQVVAMDYEEATDQMWADVSYTHDGALWRQRHQYAPLDEERIMLVRAQAPDGLTAAAWRAVAVLGPTFEAGGGTKARSTRRIWSRRQPTPVVKSVLDRWRAQLGAG